MRKILISIITMFFLPVLALANQDYSESDLAAVQGEVNTRILPENVRLAGYEDRLKFFNSVKEMLNRFEERIEKFEELKLDPYSDTYSELKQEYDTISYLVGNISYSSGKEWLVTRDEVVSRVNGLEAALRKAEKEVD